MLCDVTKVHSGYGLFPRVTHCTEDENWGKVGGSRKVFVARSIGFRGSEAALDVVIERVENQYWKIEVRDFKFWMMGFEKFQGEWITTPLQDGKIQVRYIYTLFSKDRVLFPFHWLFTKTIWRMYMVHVLENIRILAMHNEPYLYD
jgi:hypothetical protein